MDTSFGTDGAAYTDFGEGGQSSNDVAWDLAVQPDGKILAAGGATTAVPGGVSKFALVRYNPDGSLDTSFGTDGKVILTAGPTNSYIYSMVLQPNGKIAVAGTSSENFTLARYEADGSLDPTFNADGIVTTPIGSRTSGAYDLTIQSDGKLVASGYSYDNTAVGKGDTDLTLVRYNVDGNLDQAFSEDGIATTDFGTRNDGSGEDALSLTLQPDGKIVAGGSHWRTNTEGRLALARYTPNDALDTTFGTEGLVSTEGMNHP